MSKQIFWIEDDAYMLGSVTRPLEDRGYQINVVEDMHSAFEHIEDLRKCDLILLDLILPAKREETLVQNYVGLALLRQLRANGVTTPVIAFTVVTAKEAMDELRTLGVAQILHKPVLPSQLEKAICRVLGEA